MRTCRALFAVALFASAALAAEITTDKGDVIKCDEIVSVSEKEVVYQAGGKKHTRAIAEVLKIEFRDVGRPPAGQAFSQVELTDGTVVLASRWAVKKKDFEMTLLSGPSVTMPVSVVANVLNAARDEAHRREWKTRVLNTRGKEALVLSRNGVIQNLPCTLGEGDEKGETITAVITIDDLVEKITRKQSDLHGIIFKNTLGARAPAVTCRLLDTIQNVVMVSSVAARQGGGVTVTTPSGAKMDFLPGQIAQLDYTKGKLDYLSDLTPSEQTIRPSPFDKDTLSAERWFVYKDTNLENRPIKLGGKAHKKGLTLLPEVELVYDLQGAYREFSAVVGIDDESRAEGEVTLVIEGDRRELASVPIEYRTEKGKNGEPKKPPRPIKTLNLNVKDVQKLKVSLKAKDELSGLSISVSLGDAKVNK